MKPPIWPYLVLSLLVLGLPPAVAFAAPDAGGRSADQRGLQIATQADERDTGFGDTTADLTMTLFSSSGETNERRMRARILETQRGDKRVIVFDEPGDVRGTAVLTHTNLDGGDDQWIYLPAIKRTKRIASSNKSGPFMGSEFAYEDLAAQELAKYTYKYVRQETCADVTCFVIERYPAAATSGYRRQLVWLDEEYFRPWRVEYYDRNDTLLKVLTFSDYKQYNEQFWRASTMTMKNVQTGKRTVLAWSNYSFGTGLSEATFDPTRLTDIR